MYPPRDTSRHQDCAQPPAAHRRQHSRPHHHRHGEHSPTARQPHANDAMLTQAVRVDAGNSRYGSYRQLPCPPPTRVDRAQPAACSVGALRRLDAPACRQDAPVLPGSGLTCPRVAGAAAGVRGSVRRAGACRRPDAPGARTARRVKGEKEQSK